MHPHWTQLTQLYMLFKDTNGLLHAACTDTQGLRMHDMSGNKQINTPADSQGML